MTNKEHKRMMAWRNDWTLFAKEVLHARLDEEQKDILRSVQMDTHIMPLKLLAKPVAHFRLDKPHTHLFPDFVTQKKSIL